MAEFISSRNILIIYFGLLIKERTLDSIGHCSVCCPVMIVVKFLTCKIHNTDTDI